MSTLPRPRLHRVLPLSGRRLVVVDPGSRLVKLLVVDATLGQPQLVHFRTLDAGDAGPEGNELFMGQFEAFLAEAGPHERVLVLPQYRAISQIVELPAASAADTESNILREARRLSGLDENAMAFGAVRRKPYGHFLNPHWLTLCKREEVETLLLRFASPSEAATAAAEIRLSEVTTSGDALFAAATVLLPRQGSGVLVDMRRHNSVVAIVANGQGLYTTTIPFGFGHLCDAFAAAAGCSRAEAERRLAQEDVLSGAGAVAGYRAAVEKWYAELRLSITEWIEDNPDFGFSLPALPVFLAGSAGGQPGLIEHLNRLGNLVFASWEQTATPAQPWPMADYLVAYGAALQALGRAPRGVSFLPPAARTLHRRLRQIEAMQTANVVLLVVVALLLAVGLYEKSSLISRKRALTNQTTSALQTAKSIDQLYRRLSLDYEAVHPILLRQRRTIETLQALAATRQARTNDDFWYVLFADAASYQAGQAGTPPPSTNAPPVLGLLTNVPVKREFIVELCIPREGEPQRRILSDVVRSLQRDPLFARVDSLPPERKRDLVNPAVAISNRVFAIAMEVAGSELPAPVVPAERPRPAPERDPRRPSLGRPLNGSSTNR